MDFSGWDGSWPTTWGVLALVNAGLAQSKRRSRLAWFAISLFLGPIATFLIVVWPYGTHLASGTPADIARGASTAGDQGDAAAGQVSATRTGSTRDDVFYLLGLLDLIVTVALVVFAATTESALLWVLAAVAFVGLLVLTVLYLRPRAARSGPPAR